ncbi:MULTISPECIES: DUF7344 domain-containing protein [Haloarcula]|uniref:DUF7344 domain-containing protein n=1 Tax=Haloarcula TaxID=2237 RepID=UPI0023E8F02D|nr:hypothetical protein [Halomicroarcula sp. SHR3]
MKTAQCSRPNRRQLSAALADQRSRHLLSCLQDSPATVRDLAVALAATELGCARSALTSADRRQYRRQLDQHYLPRLTDTGLLERSPDGFVRYVPETLARFDVRFPSLAEPTDPSWPAAAAVLRRPYRYSLVAALAEEESLSLSRLADRLADTDGFTATPRELAIACHHVDLPKLASVDLLTYDADTRTVTSGPAIEAVL